ncbi:unnamed protein product [Tilletia controversa]|uniref:Uncharacterized protein n=3 Tax=Tilletia TaxID=13289 RepID=A0A8X7MMR3_9BASI|nr:hypothetical protein CF336_g5758 [Tilletia laevis]KAE8242142.1 hypothetical protein A4X06_0g7194 [Tilletia controversa]CAD6885091.1 unnamed protein product [Tilletia caries]CAD6900118.1 unnamed protein product [Tilletia laevis]CAD6933729.1 unnamed protein product [Tilletia caries]
MDDLSRAGWFTYIRPWISREIDDIVNRATQSLTQEVERLTGENEAIDRALRSKVRLAANIFNFSAEAAWSQREYHKNEFRTMNHRTGRKLAAELMLAAEGDLHHPTILANPIYGKCLLHFGPRSDH